MRSLEFWFWEMLIRYPPDLEIAQQTSFLWTLCTFALWAGRQARHQEKYDPCVASKGGGGELAASGEGCFFLAVPILKIGHLGSATEPPQQPRWRRVIQLTPSQRAREPLRRRQRLLPLPNYRLRSGRLSRRLPTWSSLDAEKMHESPNSPRRKYSLLVFSLVVEGLGRKRATQFITGVLLRQIAARENGKAKRAE